MGRRTSLDSIKSSESDLPKKRGNPAWIKGCAPSNPGAKGAGRISKFSAWKLSQLLDIWGPDVPKIAKLMMKNALDNDHPKQEIWAKYVIERIFPASKAIEVTGLGGSAIEMKVIVEGIQTFENVTTIEGSSEELT